MKKFALLFLTLFLIRSAFSQKPPVLPVSGTAQKVNVFLGTSGDHGQLSPAASYPFSMMSIGPQTYPTLHAGYEHKAKLFLGFTHNRIEGVGCKGSGGNILIKPFIGADATACQLIKSTESAGPGYYNAGFTNGIAAALTVYQKAGVEHYHFPEGQKGFLIDLSYAFTNRFIAEEHHIEANSISGWISSGTTCREGAYKIYYYLIIDKPVQWIDTGAYKVLANINEREKDVIIRIAFSSVDIDHAKASLVQGAPDTVKEKTKKDWNTLLNRIEVTGDPQETNLFYSLLYRTLQSPYNITEPDGTYRANDGSLQHTQDTVYNGWAIWDNYRTQLSLLSLAYPEKYRNIATSIANLYHFGKKNWATRNEPSNSVRTEHAVVVLLDAYRKGYPVDFSSILDSLVREADSLDFNHPDKALESSYDVWALSQICDILHKPTLSEKYKQQAANYKTYWNKDFKDLSKPDVDRLEARGMYQGTIWQYRWFVPFDIKGLKELCGGEKAYLNQLDEFFAKDYYNAANEPDIQAPYMYNASAEPWKSQAIIHKYAKDTVVQYYYDENYRGINPTIDRVYNNRPDALILSMDEDAGAMSGWYVLAACGISPACIGWPVYYLHVPLFKTVSFQQPKGKRFTISVTNYGKDNIYIQSVKLNGKVFNRNWITQEEIMQGGTLEITASPKPNVLFGTKDQWITDLSSEQTGYLK